MSFPYARTKVQSEQNSYSPGVTGLPNNGQPSMATLETMGSYRAGERGRRQQTGPGDGRISYIWVWKGLAGTTVKTLFLQASQVGNKGQEEQLGTVKLRVPGSLSWKAARRAKLVQDQPQPLPSRELSSFRIKVCGSSVRQKRVQCRGNTK